MATIQTSGFSGNDRLLTVVVPVEEANKEYQVIVSILPLKESLSAHSTPSTAEVEDVVPRVENGILVTGKGWPKGFFNLAGCMADDPIERGDQGTYEVRESLD
jgi:hypothetical protein